ncbi:MAG: aminotransferase class I/II-fold pyridoxal phosphate-dependent enzyme [Cyanobacteria bacterium P01_H01_bin.74]
MKTFSQPTIKSPAKRFSDLPTYAFAELDRLKAIAVAQGIKLIDLGMGNPDQPAPSPIVAEISNSLQDPANHRYPNFRGKPAYRKAVTGWMHRRYGITTLDPDHHVQPLIGSKEGLAHLSFAYIDQNDYSLVPSPYYPVHSRATWIAGGQVHHLPLKAENQFLPDLTEIPDSIAKQAKLFFVNFPNNPTTATADKTFYEKLVAFCQQHQIVLVSDLAYGEIYYDEADAPLSIFNIDGAMDVAIEFHSFSKSFSMAGFRVGFAVGNPDIINTLYAIKTNLDYGLPSIIQDGATYALNHAESFLPDIVTQYKKRRDTVVSGFQKLGWPIELPKATMYVWLPVPGGFETSTAFCEYLIEKAGIVITPGSAFGTEGEGYFRVSLVSSCTILEEALERLSKLGIRYKS